MLSYKVPLPNLGMTSKYVRVVSEDETVPPMPSQPALVTGYEPDRFQKFAIEAIERGENVLVTAKTGSGKTFVGEYQIAASLKRGGRVFYTTPIKSLSNQKFHDLKKLFTHASVGIMTGDIKFRPDAQILVMTTEILRNILFKKGSATEKVGVTSLVSMENLDAVIFDEVHYINDPDRGHVWEETLMLLPPSVKLILLSATLSQPYGFAKWLGESKKVPVWLISTQWRAVPLFHYVVGQGGMLKEVYDPREQFHGDVYSTWLKERASGLLAHDKFQQKVKDARKAGFEGRVQGKVRPKSFEHELNELLADLDRKKNLPAIVFVFSRAGCERLAAKISGDFLDSSDSAAVAHIWDFHLSRYRETLEKSPQAHTLRTLAMRGIAYHHSGLLPFMKEILEILFSKGLIKVLFATETFAVGINMPTKTVVFTALDKFSDGGIRPLRSSEYIQMAGRAGRRGKDDRGLVIYLPQREPVDLACLRSILTGRAASFESRMGFHYDFVLKMLLSGLSRETLVESTYWWTLLHGDMERSRQDYENALVQVASVRGVLSDVQESACAERQAIEQRISSSQNAKKKAAQRELLAWQADHGEKSWNHLYDQWLKLSKTQGECQTLRCVYEDLVACVENVNRALPQIERRLDVLQGYGFVTEDGVLTSRGQLASEIHEGHPFLMVDLFQRLQGTVPSLPTLLSILSLFLGEAGEREDVEGNIAPEKLSVSRDVRDEIMRIIQDSDKGYRAELAAGLPDDRPYWTLSTEWVEPVTQWITHPDLILPKLAVDYGLFEGNIQRALMKLMGLVEEFRALCQLSGAVEWLTVLEGAQEMVMRGVVVAESLYLRL
jgi:superfamily II RNA helicase